MGILSSPFRGMMRVFKEVAQRAEDELYNEDAVKAELMEMYRQLEAGSLSEVAFAHREEELVERLDAIAEYQKRKRGGRGTH
jgi:hypothetical protein